MIRSFQITVFTRLVADERTDEGTNGRTDRLRTLCIRLPLYNGLFNGSLLLTSVSVTSDASNVM